MKIELKELEQQVMVITGASSGIGLVTARAAAKQGARLVLAARSEDALCLLTDEIIAGGGEAIYVVADVGDAGDVQNIANKAIDRFGQFDTWVNNAGVSIYGQLLEVPVEDMRQLFETNFWGVVHGSLVAAQHLRWHGGTIINVGSTLSDRAVPLQGAYCASKHAVKGFTDSLRMELEAAGEPVSVTLVKPAGIDTPYVHHAKNFMDVEPKNVSPVYAPSVVADVILHCAVHPQRDVFAGAGGKIPSALGYHAPRLTDHFMEKFTLEQQRTDQPSDPEEHRGLYEPSGKLQERGNHPGHVFKSSLYSKASLHPVLSTVLAVGAGVAVAALVRSAQSKPIKKKAHRLRKTVRQLGQRVVKARVRRL